MSRFKKIILFALVLLIGAVATFVKDVENGLSDKGFPDDGARAKIEWSKQKGVFVTEVKLDPDSQTFEGNAVQFTSAWIERKIKTKPFLVWWEQTEYRPGYYLVVRCEPHGAIEDHGMYLVRDGQGHSFSMHGTDSLDESLEESDFASGSAQLFLVTNWNAPRINPITASWSH